MNRLIAKIPLNQGPTVLNFCLVVSLRKALEIHTTTTVSLRLWPNASDVMFKQ